MTTTSGLFAPGYKLRLYYDGTQIFRVLSQSYGLHDVCESFYYRTLLVIFDLSSTIVLPQLKKRLSLTTKNI